MGKEFTIITLKSGTKDSIKIIRSKELESSLTMTIQLLIKEFSKMECPMEKEQLLLKMDFNFKHNGKMV